MNYRDVYFSRINHLGDTTAERVQNTGIRTFQKWLDSSPHTVQHLSVDRGIYFDAIILTNKDKEYQKIMFLNVANEIPLVIGDIMNWTVNGSNIEKWIIIQEEKKVNGSYRTFWIIRCNYLLKWVDANGHIQQSWAYLLSSTDDKIKGNFRTWNNLITPQPNKYAEILMPRYPIERSTNFIVEDESWNVIEYDHTSVPGVIYLSLTENKVNLIYDDLTNNIADTDKIAQYDLSVPSETQIFAVGDIINPVFTLTKNGVPVDLEVEYLPVNKSVARIVNTQLTAVGNGTTDIIIQLKDYPQIQQKITIEVSNQEQIFSAYIEGADTIRLDRDSQYELKGTDEINGSVIYTIDTSLATIKSITNNICTIHANDKNILGSFILTATYNNVSYTKTIKIIPLW